MPSRRNIRASVAPTVRNVRIAAWIRLFRRSLKSGPKRGVSWRRRRQASADEVHFDLAVKVTESIFEHPRAMSRVSQLVRPYVELELNVVGDHVDLGPGM